MRATRPFYFIAFFLFVGLFLTASLARAETPLIEILRANPKWFGTVDATRQLAVTFHVTGDPPALESISYRWEQERERNAIEIKLGNADVEFMIPPESRNRWYKLKLTNDGALLGTLAGLTTDKKRNFEEIVYLRPVGAPKGAVTELKGSAKHCSVPPDFVISDGKNLAPELRQFLGFFSGYWGDKQLYHTLMVSEITKDGDAVVYYAHETYEPWNINRPRCGRHKANIEDGTLIIKTIARGNVLVKYRFSDADTLEATYARNNRITPGTFKRQ